MTTKTERPVRATAVRETGAGRAPADRRPRPAVRWAEAVLGAGAAILFGPVVPIAGIPAAVLLRRRLAGTGHGVVAPSGGRLDLAAAATTPVGRSGARSPGEWSPGIPTPRPPADGPRPNSEGTSFPRSARGTTR